MATEKLLVSDRYRCGKRSFVYTGDKIRVSGGPYYVSTADDGKRARIPMGERGEFVFRRYCQRGASKWIEATNETGTAVIYVGRPRPSPRIDGLRLRPHRIRPVYPKKKRKTTLPTVEQLTLFE